MQCEPLCDTDLGHGGSAQLAAMCCARARAVLARGSSRVGVASNRTRTVRYVVGFAVVRLTRKLGGARYDAARSEAPAKGK